MDAPPASPPPGIPVEVAPTIVAPAATDIGPRTAEERDLCDRASTPDYLYMGATLLLVAGAIYADGSYFKDLDSPGTRTIGPGVVGLTWGAMVGGLYPSMPRCRATWVRYAPPEGDVRSDVPIAFAMAMLAGATAPLMVGIETGSPRSPHDADFGRDKTWEVEERSARLVVAGVAGFAGAFVPYLLAPRPYRAGRKLDALRAGSDGHGAYFVGWSGQF